MNEHCLSLGLILSLTTFGCSGVAPNEEVEEAFELGVAQHELVSSTVPCSDDPRVLLGLVSEEVCEGSKIFFNETFNGNGRTCGTCHRPDDNYTISPSFIDALPADDPLFVGAPGTDLDGLESVHLTDGRALIKEHVDGFEDEPNKFTLRGVPHLLSLETTLKKSTKGKTNQTLGWSGDATDGTLTSFLEGAIRQHLPKQLKREEGVDFRLPTADEARQVEAFQRSLGRVERLKRLDLVSFGDPFAETGRELFLDREKGNCSFCHSNGGAGLGATHGDDHMRNTGAENLFSDDSLEFPTFAGVTLRDGGMGGQGLSQPNFPPEAPNSFGDGRFNTVSIIEAADTGPFFHNNGANSIVEVVAFYAAPPEGGIFNASPAGQTRPVNLNPDEVARVGQFLRAINGAFNLAMTEQRLEAAEAIAQAFGWMHHDIQIGLIELAEAELDDALDVLGATEGPQMYISERSALESAKHDLNWAKQAPWAGWRLWAIKSALDKIRPSRAALGSDLNFVLGEGNLMF